MILDHPPSYADLSAFLAEQIRILELGVNLSDIGVNFARVSGLTSEQWSIPGDDNDVPCHVVFLPGYQFYLWGGTQTLRQAVTLASAYVDPVSSVAVPGVPAGIARQGRAIFNPDYGIPVLGNQRVILCGHSQGGAVAAAMAGHPSLRGRTQNISVITFGAPRTGTIDFLRVVGGLAMVRWMNDNDPVPLLPPSFATAPSMFLAGIINVSIFYENYRHHFGGVVLSPQGGVTTAEIPPYGVISGSADLATWLYSWETDVRTGHSIQTYIDRLNLLAGLQFTAPRVQVQPASPEPNRNTPRRTLNQQTDGLIQAISASGTSQQNAQLVVPPDRAFRTVKFEGMWWVTFGGQLVAVGPTRKRAGSMAVRGNEFLRRLQRMAGVDNNALKNLFPAYLDAASTPDNGFSPPIHEMTWLS